MIRTWYRVCHWLCAHLYFEQITVLHRERLPARGPVIYLGTHRNGAVDGFTYRQVLPRSEFLISTQLLRSVFARLFFHGIPVTRDKDEGHHGQNEAALTLCRERVAAGGDLFIFPEGTSTLGPRHLPFKSGAARIAHDCLAHGLRPTIVPVGIHYERAWEFRSKAEIVIGPPIDTRLDPTAGAARQIVELKRRFTAALESVGVNFNSTAEQQQAENLAYAATLGSGQSYFRALKTLEAGVPEPLLACWREVEAELAARDVWRHQGVPLFPTRPWPLYALALALLTPIVLAGFVANLPPLLAGGLAAKKCADDRNVIALWRILVGVPVFALWFTLGSATLLATAGWPWVLVYFFLTWAALRGWYRTKKLAVAVGNAVRHGDSGPRIREFHLLLLRTLADEKVVAPPTTAGAATMGAAPQPRS